MTEEDKVWEADEGAELALLRRDIHAAIDAERDRQGDIWGGVVHDQTHNARDWMVFITCQLAAMHAAYESDNGAEYRRRLINVAALAVAAIEAWEL